MTAPVTHAARGWRTFATLALSATVTLVAVDLLLQRVSPVPPPLLEVEDGVAAWEAGQPDVLVLGSSHTRSFVPMRDVLKARIGKELVLVTVEWGTMGSYEWVLDNRFLSALQSKPRLRDVVLVTTFFDFCSADAVSSRSNLPARAWRVGDFARSVLSDGLTVFNRNYVQRRWNRLFVGSVLVQDRGHGRVVADLRDAVRPRGAEADAAARAAAIASMRAELDTRFEACHDPAERAAFERIVSKVSAAGLELTVVAFALVPGAVSEQFEGTTLVRFRGYLESFAARGEIRLVDFTLDSPLSDDDFMDDMDHVRPARNPALVEWLLADRMAFLLPGKP